MKRFILVFCILFASLAACGGAPDEDLATSGDAIRSSRSLRFVGAIYRGYLGREPDAPGLSYWASLIEHGVSRSTVVYAIATSPEGSIALQTNFASQSSPIDTAYWRLLERDAEPGGLAHWNNIAATQGLVFALIGIMNSQEFFNVATAD